MNSKKYIKDKNFRDLVASKVVSLKYQISLNVSNSSIVVPKEILKSIHSLVYLMTQHKSCEFLFAEYSLFQNNI